MSYRASRLAGACLVAFLAGCRADNVAPPEIRQPLEDLPAGAEAIGLGSDFGNTWKRAESHQLWALASERAPFAAVLARPEIEHFRSAIAAYEARTGKHAEEDLLLNALGQRVAVGIYPEDRHHTGDSDLTEDRDRVSGHGPFVLVAEITDPDRFRSAFDALQGADLGTDVRIEPATLADGSAWRVHSNGASFLVHQKGGFLAVSNEDSLASAAHAVHSGRLAEKALREPAFATALASIGPHNVVLLHRGEEGQGWSAQGITWDPQGLHFERMHAASSTPAADEATPMRRDAMLGSLPDGLAFACYARGSDLRLGSAPGAGLPLPANVEAFLPPEIRAQAGDEIAFGLLGVEPTAVAPVPNIAIVLELRDVAGATSTLRALESTFDMVRIQGARHQFEDVEYGGTTFRSLMQPISQTLTPSWIVVDGIAIVTTTRDLMQQIVDTRRTGKRSLLADASFHAFRDFVPPDAAAVAYADQRRLHRALEQLEPSTSRWGADISRAVREAASLAALSEHFPAGAAYAMQEDDRFAVRGWLVEGD